MRRTSLPAMLALTALCSLGSAAYGAIEDEPIAQQGKVLRGTVYGEVKKVQPDAVIVKADGEEQEARLTLHPSTQMGPVKEGDRVYAFVTPGGTTTSIQPVDARWYR
ncbi:hypothetical protein [Candidatus Nitrospira bockiana]